MQLHDTLPKSPILVTKSPVRCGSVSYYLGSLLEGRSAFYFSVPVLVQLYITKLNQLRAL